MSNNLLVIFGPPKSGRTTFLKKNHPEYKIYREMDDVRLFEFFRSGKIAIEANQAPPPYKTAEGILRSCECTEMPTQLFGTIIRRNNETKEFEYVQKTN